VKNEDNLVVKMKKGNNFDDIVGGEEYDEDSDRERVLSSALMAEPPIGMDENVLRIVERR
jgi:hypothetical protein